MFGINIRETIILGSCVLFFIGVPGRADDSIGPGRADSVLEAMALEVEAVIDRGTGMSADDLQARIAGIEASWQAFRTIRNENPWDRGAAVDSIINAVEVLLMQAAADFRAHGVESLADAYREAAGRIKMLTTEFEKPILADFGGARCKACKTMKARLEKIGDMFRDRVRIVMVDVNTQRELTKKFQVMLIPTLVFIDRRGEEVYRNVGEMEEKAIRIKLDELLEE